MIVVAALEAVALVVVVFLLLRHFGAQEHQAMLERRELLTRIQHPEAIPVADREPFVFPDQEDDELNLVGAILEPPAEEDQ